MLQKKGAMELSMGTIVILVLSMVLLVGGIVFINNILGTGNNAINSIDSGVNSELQKAFATGDKKLSVYPTSQVIEMKKGEVGGFAFDIKNRGVEASTFEYKVETDPAFSLNCGAGFTDSIANGFIRTPSGSQKIGPGDSLDNPVLIRFTIPENTPPCLIRYNLEVTKDGQFYSATTMDLDIK